MLDFLKNNPRYLAGAIIVHVFFIVLFGVGFHFKSEQRRAAEQPQTVTVNTVDESQVKKELQQLKASDEREQRAREEAIRQRKAEEQRLADVRRERETEQRKEKERLALLEKQKQAEAEKRRQDEIRRKEDERKRQEEQARLEKQRQEEARAEQQRREKELQEKLLAEQQRMAQEQEAAAQRRAELQKKQTLIDKYMSLIESRVYQNWIKPPSADKGLICELQVRLIPSGEVINIELSKSSGDEVYDKSVIAAVRKASPFPLPPAESGLFEVFRDLHLPVRADKKT